MTEKTLLVENPFKFEQHQKLFIQQLEQLQEEELPSDELGDVPLGPRERLQKQTKKYGIIRALDEEAEKIAKAREEVLLKDLQNERSKTTKHKSSKSLKLWDVQDYEPKKGLYKVKSLLKEKKETIGEFIKKKREICLSNMNISNKIEETNRLEDFIKNEQESLKARRQYFQKDSQLVKTFMVDVENAAKNATKGAEEEAKTKEKLKSQITRLLVQIDNCENKNERLREDINFLNSYKVFIEKARKQMEVLIEEKKKNKKLKQLKSQQKAMQQQKQQQQQNELDPAFLTQPQQAGSNMSQSRLSSRSRIDDNSVEDENQEKQQKLNIQLNNENIIQQPEQNEEPRKYPGIDFEPADLVAFLDQIENKNLTYIHDKFEAEDDLTKQKSYLKELEVKLEDIQTSNQQKIKELKKQLATAQQRRQNLEDQNRINTDKVKLTEGSELKFEQIQEKINSIHDIVLKDSKDQNQKDIKNSRKEKDKGERNESKEVNSQIMKQKMLDIEQKLYDLHKITTKMEMEDEQTFKQSKQYVQQQHQKKLQEQKQQLLEKEKYSQKNNSQEKATRQSRKGRLIMHKSIIIKKEKKQEVQEQENSDGEEKYLQEGFDMVQNLKIKN